MTKKNMAWLEWVEWEEKVGAWWHRLITAKTNPTYPQAAVHLKTIEKMIGVYFRALGGDGGLEVVSADAIEHGANRSFWQKIAGTGKKISLAWRDEQALHLPLCIDIFAQSSLNRDLYFWLATLAALDKKQADPWLVHNQKLTRWALECFPGIRSVYQRLMQAHLEQRKSLKTWHEDEQAQEKAIYQALYEPGSVAQLPPARRPPYPVPLWLHPNPPKSEYMTALDPPPTEPAQRASQPLDIARKQAQSVDQSDSDRGLIAMRMENIFSWGEAIALDRSTDDEEDEHRAEEVARDLDRISLTRQGKTAKNRIKFDLDLPAESVDDQIINDGLRLPEWDWKKQVLLPDRCRVVELLARDAAPIPLPERLKKTAARLKNQFQALAPGRRWYKAQPDGQEIDLEAYLKFYTDRAGGCSVSGDRLYRQMRAGVRDLSCLLLADLSLSTDTWINDQSRILDVIQDSLYLFAESLHSTGDDFSIYGFSSRKRDPIRIHRIKSFQESYSALIRGRIQMIKPGYYTRLGAAIRYATEQLKMRSASRRLLLILSDGKPNDLDQYEGRYGIEDTRQAVHACRQAGFYPFCVTIDREAQSYLPHLFGQDGFVVIHHPTELPAQLPLLYARLTADSF